MHNVEKRSNILYKSCGVYTTIFLEYVWSFFNIMHERVVNRSSIPWSLTANMYLEFWSSLAIQLLNTDRAGYINIYHYIATEVRQKLFPTCSFLAFFFHSHYTQTSFNHNQTDKYLLKNISKNFWLMWWMFPANIYLFEVNNRNTRKKFEICSELTIKKP